MSVVVLASAGTGKTWTLVDAWLRAALHLSANIDGSDDDDDNDAFHGTGSLGTGPASSLKKKRRLGGDDLCAITFTEKAAAEMKSRVAARLADLVFAPEKEPELVAALARLPRPPGEAALQALRRSVARAPIGTFHALCGRLLREHALAAGLDPGFRILEPDEEQRMLAELAEGVILDALAQGDAVVADLVARLPLRGIFQRRGLVECLVGLRQSLAERGRDPEHLDIAPPCGRVDDALDAVEAAVADLEAATKSTGKKPSDAVMSRVHTVRHTLGSVRALRAQLAFSNTSGPSAPKNVDPRAPAPVDESFELQRQILAMQEASGRNWGGAALKAQRIALVESLQFLGAAVVDEASVPVGPVVRDLLVELETRERREKDQRAVLGFGDLLVRTRDLLRDDRSVRARIKARYRRIFVDEYQDTSPTQEQILALLAEAPARGGTLAPLDPFSTLKPPRGRLFVVGDPKQSIYGFRGADAEVFRRVQRHLTVDTEAGADATGVLQTLSISRRSSPSVCAFVNAVTASALPDHADEFLIPLPVTTTANDDVDDGGRGLLPVGRWWRASPALKAGPKLPAVELEALLVADRLVHLIQDGVVALNEVLVLTRRGRSTAIMGRALSRRGIPVQVVGGDGFWRRPEIIDVVSALSLVVDNRDELSVLTLLRSPFLAIPDDQILAIFEARPSERSAFSWTQVVDAVDDALVQRDVADRVRQFDALLRSLRASLATKPLTAAIDTLIDEGGYAVACAVEIDAALRLRHLEKLRGLCAGRPEDGVLAIARLVDALDDPPAEAVLFDVPAGQHAVRIMTIHQSKGLEAEVVVLADAGIAVRSESDDILYDVDVGLAVSARSKLTPKPSASHTIAMQRVRKARRLRDEGELARLLYVALTRARRHIYVVGEARRAGPGSMLGLLDHARGGFSPPASPAEAPSEAPSQAPSQAPSDASTANPVLAAQALLPDEVVEGFSTLRLPRPKPSVPPPQGEPIATTISPAAPLPTADAPRPLRIRASALHAMATPQLHMGLLGDGPGLDDDVIPPRARGRLAHAVIALVASDLPEAMADVDTCTRAIQRALEAIGAPPGAVDDVLTARIAATLCGPVATLLAEGRDLSFEEPSVLATDVAVVEGTADLVARGPRDTLVVEFKLSRMTARGPAAAAQVQSCCAGLEQQGLPGTIRYGVWAIGETDTPTALWGKPAKRELAEVLARLPSVVGGR